MAPIVVSSPRDYPAQETQLVNQFQYLMLCWTKKVLVRIGGLLHPAEILRRHSQEIKYYELKAKRKHRLSPIFVQWWPVATLKECTVLAAQIFSHGKRRPIFVSFPESRQGTPESEEDPFPSLLTSLG